jgi:D-alanyl-D-alanine endopeptidase (penicillin-binding protein 7)
LLVIRTRLFRNIRLISVLAVIGGFGLPTGVYGQTTASPTAPTDNPKLSLPTKSGKKKKTYSASSARARRARLAKARAARAAAQARALKEAQTPKFKLDENGSLVPDLRAEAAIIYNPNTGEVLWEENSQSPRSIASITKVMTAAVFLEGSPDLSRKVVIQRPDVRRASTTYLRAGDKVTTNDLLHLLLIASDNAAARVLARVSPYGSEGFIERMNDKARELGLATTHYADPSGLLAANISSAYDMARLIAYVAGDERIAEIMRKEEYSAALGRRSVTVRSTNQLVRQGDVDVLSGKTGFISKAGYCLATLLRLPQGGPPVAVVVLGAKSNAGRFWETRHLFNWLSGKAQDLFGGTPLEAAAATAN